MKILAVSYLFPNAENPNYGIFVLNRLSHVNALCRVKVINPVPWFPFSFLFARYRGAARAPRREIMGDMEVFHPRFFVIPRFFKFLDAFTFALAVLPLALQLRKTFDFDLIDLHWTYPDLPVGRLLSRLTKKPQLVTIRGKEALCMDESGPRAWMIQWGVRNSHRIITLSKGLKKNVLRMGAAQEKVTDIRNGVDDHVFKYMDQAACRKRLGLPQDETILLSVGALIHRKGHDRAVQALDWLSAGRPDIRLYIIGSQGPEGDFKKALVSRIQALNLQDRVCFVGQVVNRELPLWYNSADLFCLLSRGEGSPNVLTEALACGCPSVSTRVGAVPEILDQPFMGTVVPNTDEISSSVFTDALEKKYDRRRIAAHMNSFGWPWCAQHVMNIYKELVHLK